MKKIDTAALDIYEMLATALVQSDQPSAVSENAECVLASVERIRAAIAAGNLPRVVRETVPLLAAWEKIHALQATSKAGLSAPELESIEEKATALVQSAEQPEEVRGKAAWILMGAKAVRAAMATGNPEHIFRETQSLVGECESLVLILNDSTIKKGEKFIQGPKQPRTDALSAAMLRTAERLMQKRGKLPTAKQLWDALPEGRTPDGPKFEKDRATDNERYITWCKNGKPPATATDKDRAEITPFKLFKDRYTTIRKKINNPQK